MGKRKFSNIHSTPPTGHPSQPVNSYEKRPAKRVKGFSQLCRPQKPKEPRFARNFSKTHKNRERHYTTQPVYSQKPHSSLLSQHPHDQGKPVALEPQNKAFENRRAAVTVPEKPNKAKRAHSPDIDTERTPKQAKLRHDETPVATPKVCGYFPTSAVAVDIPQDDESVIIHSRAADLDRLIRNLGLEPLAENHYAYKKCKQYKWGRSIEGWQCTINISSAEYVDFLGITIWDTQQMAKLGAELKLLIFLRKRANLDGKLKEWNTEADIMGTPNLDSPCAGRPRLRLHTRSSALFPDPASAAATSPRFSRLSTKQEPGYLQLMTLSPESTSSWSTLNSQNSYQREGNSVCVQLERGTGWYTESQIREPKRRYDGQTSYTLSKQHRDERETGLPKCFQCSDCPKGYSTSAALERHRQILHYVASPSMEAMERKREQVTFSKDVDIDMGHHLDGVENFEDGDEWDISLV